MNKLFRFREYLQESPMIDDYVDHLRDKTARATINYNLLKNHHKADKLYDTKEGSVFHNKDGKNHVYYHLVNNSPREYSDISPKNVQEYASKLNGSSNEIKNFMYHHAREHGKVITDKLHSPGAKKLWTSIVNDGNNEFSVYHTNQKTGEEHQVTPKYLSDNEHNIWNRTLSARNHRLELRHKK